MNMAPDVAASTWKRGKQLFLEGNWREAEEALTAALDGVRREADDEVLERSVVDLEYVPLMLELAELLILKERKQDSRALLQEIINIIEDLYPDEEGLLLDAYLSYIDALSMCDDFAEAEPYIDQAVELAEEKPEHIANGKLIQALTTKAASYLAQEQFEEAGPVIDSCLALCTKHGITKGDAVCSALLFKGLLLHLGGAVDQSEETFLKALEAVREETHSRSFQDVCFGYTTLLVSQSRFSDAIAFLNKEIVIRESQTAPEHPLLKRAIASIAIANAAYGDLEEAEVHAQRYHRLVEMMGNAGAELRIDCLRTLVDILVEQSRYADAEVLLNRANDILENLQDNYVKATLISDVARLKVELGQYDEAERLCTRALAMTTEIKGEEHIETAMCLSILGSAYFSNRKINEAEATYRRAIELIEKHHHFFTSFVGAENYRNLGIILTQQKKFEEAEEMFLKILAHHEKNNGQLQVQMAETHRNLGELFEAQNKNHEALGQYEIALAIAKNIYGPENAEVSDYVCFLADIHRRDSRFTEAEELYKKALKILENTLGPQHPKTCTLLQRFGEMAIEKKEFIVAEEYFMSALQRLEQTLGTMHPEIGYTCYCLGAAFHWQEKLPRAEEFYKRALAIKEKQLGRKHQDLANIIEPLIDILAHQKKYPEVEGLQRRMLEIKSYDAQKQRVD
jgi:tetratricopeptide (TPR) repeat protein